MIDEDDAPLLDGLAEPVAPRPTLRDRFREHIAPRIGAGARTLRGHTARAAANQGLTGWADREKLTAAVALLVVAPGLWLGISTSPAATNIDGWIDHGTGVVGHAWETVRYARPSYVSAAGKATAARALRGLRISGTAPDHLADPHGRAAQCTYAKQQAKTDIRHHRKVSPHDRDELARWIGRCPS